MPQANIHLATEKLFALAQEVGGFGAVPVRFTYGWDENRRPLEGFVAFETILNELAKLYEFLEGAQTSGFDVYCQL